MKTVSSRDANQRFSKLLAEAEQGRETIITKRGVPVAKMVPFRARKMSRERKAAIADLMAMLEKGWDIDYANNKMTRDEMHER